MLTVFVLLLLILMLYAWGGYSLVLAWRARGRRHDVAAGAPPRPFTLAVILSAYNEADHIAARIDNLVARLPAGQPYEVHIGVDGCDDDTAEVARRAAAAHAGVRVHAFKRRRGKVAVLKELVGLTSAEILLFTDANTIFLAGAVERLLRHFVDPRVGGVCGKLVLTSHPERFAGEGQATADPGVESEEGFYWRRETQLKVYESRIDSCLGANGAIFALRRELFRRDLPDNTMVDDFVIGMHVRERGRRMLYEPEAVAVEELPHVRHEWRRRVRIGAGDYQALMLCRACLRPRYGRFAWMFWSHKVLRWFTPHAAVLLAAAAPALAARDEPLARGLGLFCLALVALFLVMSALGAVLRGSAAPAARVPILFLHFTTMQAALLAGFLRFARGNLSGHWQRTPRRAAGGAGTGEERE